MVEESKDAVNIGSRISNLTGGSFFSKKIKGMVSKDSARKLTEDGEEDLQLS